MFEVTGKMEINAIDFLTPLPRISEFVFKHRCPAIVTLPQFVPAFVADREAKRGLYRVIAAVDFPDGSNFAMQKVRDMGADASAADGFDILCSPDKQENEAFNEVKSVTEFLRSLNQFADIRWVLGAYGRPYKEVQNYLNAFTKARVNWLRTDQHVTDPNIAPSQHYGIVDSIRRACTIPIKISGNVTREVVEHYAKDKAIRFDVTLDQATSILASYETVVKPETPKQPEKPNQSPTENIEGQKVTGIIGQDVKA